jgi:hypothetical protein
MMAGLNDETFVQDLKRTAHMEGKMVKMALAEKT